MASRQIRPIRVEGNAAYIPLTKGCEAVIDAKDAPIVDRWNWCAMVRSNTIYAYRYRTSGTKKGALLLHRALMDEPKGLDVDHRDGDGLNNRRSNLRAATHAENQRNQRLAKNNTSGFKGVTWHKARAKWQAQIVLNGRNHFLGYFRCQTAAAVAYAKASAEFHGEFGRT